MKHLFNVIRFLVFVPLALVVLYLLFIAIAWVGGKLLGFNLLVLILSILFFGAFVIMVGVLLFGTIAQLLSKINPYPKTGVWTVGLISAALALLNIFLLWSNAELNSTKEFIVSIFFTIATFYLTAMYVGVLSKQLETHE